MPATIYFNRFSSYCKMVSHAKNLAKRSVLIDHCGFEHIDLSSNFTNVEHVYSIEKENKRGFSKLSLIEFKTKEDADNLMHSAKHIEGLLPVPLKILRYNGRNSVDPSQQDLSFPVERVRLTCDRELSLTFKNYTELVSNNVMSLVALKLRFVTLVNFEKILCSGMFDEYELMPFGSSVIDMGSDSGDLDLIITRKVDHHQAILNATTSNTYKPLRESKSSLSLVHLDKSIYSESKDSSGFRGAMRWFDHVLREYMPLTDGFGVLTLHRAKVPIIKFTSRITNIDCDLSFDLGLHNREPDTICHVHSGIMMTEILYSICRNNNLITALVIYLRLFARINAITSKVPGIGMTNFQFLSLIIFFLQQTIVKKVQIRHPSHQIHDNSYQNQHNPESANYKFVISSVLQPKSTNQKLTKAQISQHQSDNPATDSQKPLVPPFKLMVNGEFMRDGSTMDFQHYEDNELNQILPLLIARFFDFYSTFDFNQWSLNLYESRQDRKLDNSSIYVLNPLEPGRNICHNVNRKALDHLVKQLRSTSPTDHESTMEITSDMDDEEFRDKQLPTKTCPLSLIKGRLLKLQKQVKKSRMVGQPYDLSDVRQEGPHVSSNRIAQDVCR